MTEPTQHAQSSPEEPVEITSEEVQELADQFTKELDLAIEEKRLGDIPGLKLYAFDATEREYSIKTQGVEYKHRLRMPDDIDEIRREAMSVTIRQNAGKFQGDDMVSAVREDSNALKRFYDALGKSVYGYPLNDDDELTWIDLSTVVEKAPEGSDQKSTTLLDYIPDADKMKVAAMVHGGQCFVIFEKNKRIRSIRSRREYVVKQLFGVDTDDDGVQSRPTEVVAYHFNEGSAADIGFFDTRCRPSKTLIKKQGNPEERTTISIAEASTLFGRLINYIQGGSIKGEEVRNIAVGDERLKQIPGRCKTDAVFVYMNFLKS